MKQRLTQTSEGYALILDAELLAAAGIDPEADIEVSSTGSSIVVAVAVTDDARAQRVREAVALAHQQYGAVFRRLAQ